MNFYIFLINFIAILFGYLIGSINFAIIFSKKSKKEDIREKGSRNAGATNALRVYGKKAGLLIFLLDVIKSVVAVLVFWIILSQTRDVQSTGNEFQKSLAFIIPQIAGFGVIIGHIWPVFFKFKGGKGAASLAGLFITVNLVLFLIGIVIFLTIYKLWKNVGFSSIVSPLIMIGLTFIPWMTQSTLGNLNQTFDPSLFWISGLVLLISHIFVIGAHHPNIKNMIKNGL
ncbi:glycerol-3-phosphate 1-O-acyltransferase PlsY [Mycoplasma iguanae]|uniref:Glycerol-3-phosphate acyltransferase n=1 Tax=Mycoplasma iguanae TaxID=292461 RepID=A0ABY5R7L3_9MOLU|nr:glycerol-3-phosphate 1-O-acyltransferase PlsY [Mycoplasma iguanae]UVD81501.1 glycerol-3-phosphate 1-O-acyltransferase PlsY [Mycoplasma iguanae]